jgi:hypothetical protein
MSTKYEVTTRRSAFGRKRNQLVEAEAFTQDKGTATFTDREGRQVITVKRVVRVCWP